MKYMKKADYTEEEVDLARNLRREGFKLSQIQEYMKEEFGRTPSLARLSEWAKTMKDDRLNAVEMDINILMEEIVSLKAKIAALPGSGRVHQ